MSDDYAARDRRVMLHARTRSLVDEEGHNLCECPFVPRKKLLKCPSGLNDHKQAG